MTTRVTILHGSTSGRLRTAVEGAVGGAATVTAVHHLRDETLAACRGCFECWVKTPGACRTHDAANGVMADIIAADVIVLTTRPRFGTWDPLVKSALDRSIGLLSPFFTTKGEGETHHSRRYGAYPRWLVVTEEDAQVTPRQRHLFDQLVGRNALNLHGDAHRVVQLSTDADTAGIEARVHEGLQRLLEQTPMDPVMVEPFADRALPSTLGGRMAETDRKRHAVLWVGSAKPAGQSTSEALGRELLSRLQARGFSTEVAYVARTVRLSHQQAPSLQRALSRADLIVLASPVYVDTLPALVLAGLVALGRRPAQRQHAPALLPMLQCGFPELSHTALAVHAAQQAAEALGWVWAGHLAMGSGGMIAGRPLERLGGRVHSQIDALEQAAATLAAGCPVDAGTSQRFSHVPLPALAYRVIGDAGWLAQAQQHGALLKMWDQPFRSDKRDD